MPQCISLRRKKRQPCIGDMDELITLQERDLTPPPKGVDASETFTDTNPDIWAMIETVTGEKMFDDVGVERDVTHKFTIGFIDGISSETWILFNDDRIDVLDVQDYEERHEFLVLRASNRGNFLRRANDA